MLEVTELEPIKAAVVTSSLDGIIMVDQDGKVLALNPSAEAMFGYGREEAIGRPIAELIVPEHLREPHRKGFAAYVAGGPPKLLGQRVETEALRKDGSLFPVELTILEVVVEGRRVFTASIRDRSAHAAQEEELEIVRRHLELAIEGAQLGVWSFDPKTGSSWYSDRAKALLELDDNFMADSRDLAKSVHPDDWGRLAAPYLTTYPEHPLSIEYRVLKPDGGIRWVYGLGAAIRDEDGVPLTVHGIVFDITDRKQADEELGHTRRQLELAIEGANLGVWTFSPVTGAIWYSDRSREIYSIGENDPLDAQTLRSRVHPDDWERLASPYFSGFPDEPLAIEYRVLRPDGRVRWVYALGAAARDQHGNAQAVHGIHIDITDRKQAEDELEDTREQLHLAVEGAKLGIWSFDTATGSAWFSDRARDLLGLDGNLLQDARDYEKHVHPEDWERIVAPQFDHFPEEPRGIEYRVVLSDGETRWIYSLGAVSRDDNDVIDAVHGIVFDVTARKQAEEELARSRDALVQSEKLAALGALLAGVSHELNNPLAAIVGQAEMLAEDSVGTPFETRAKKIGTAAERSARIVQTFLAMARQRERQPTLVSINDVIDSALDLTDYALRTGGVAVRLNFGSGLPPVQGDRDQLHQVLVNLIVNAQQAMEKGEAFEKMLTIRTSVNQAGRVLVDISDSGPGVPEEMRHRIFEPFFTTKKQGRGGGTGIGLSFSQGVIAAHGGTLTVEPTKRGAHFRIELPAAPGEPIVVVPQDKIVPLPELNARRRCLVVEDEADVAETLRELIEREGFEVTLAANGTEAFFALDQGDFDLLFSDLRMPLLNGPELYERLCEIRPELVKHMAFVTGDTMGDSMDEFLSKCGRPILEKPFTRAGVRAVLAALVEPAGNR